MNCVHKFTPVDSSILYIGNESKMIDSYQCTKCSKWYFKVRKTGERVMFNDDYRGDEVEADFNFD